MSDADRDGFRVVRDHDGTQRGSECGITAAKVLVHLKQAGAGFMDSVATHATRYASFKYDGDATLEAGNLALDSAGYFPEAKKEALRVQGLNWLHAAGSLMDSDVEIVLDAFNGGVSVLWANAMGESRFAPLPAYDAFLKTLAKNIRQVSLGVEGASRRVYSITNTENSQSMGFHWVAIVFSIRKKTQAELVAERQAQALDHLGHPPDAAQTGPAPGVAQAGAAAGAAGPAASPTAGTAVEMDCDMAQALWFVLCLFSAALALLGFSPAVPPLPREGFFHEAALFSIICLTSRMCAAAFSCASWPERSLFGAQSTTHRHISQSGNSNSHYNTPM